MKKKGQAADADVTMNGVEIIKVLMASYVEDNTSQDKNWIIDSGSPFMCVPRRSYSTL